MNLQVNSAQNYEQICKRENTIPLEIFELWEAKVIPEPIWTKFYVRLKTKNLSYVY